MSLLTGGTVQRAYSFKRFASGGKVQTFCNRQDFLGAGEESEGNLYLMLEAFRVAEQHLLHNEVEMNFRVAIPLTVANMPGLQFKAYAEFFLMRGGLQDYHLSPAAPFPVVLNVRKYPTHGRTGKMYYAGALREMDIRRDERGRVYLRPGHDPANLQHDFFHAKMFESPLLPVISTSVGGSFQPVSVRAVEKFGGFTAQRLTSIPDAQQRKTYVAFPYRAMCHDLAPLLQVAGNYWWWLAHERGAEVNTLEVSNFFGVLAPVVQQIEQVMEYYDEGTELSLAPNWRPSAGLNPYTMAAQDLINRMVEVSSKFTEEIQDLISIYPETVPQHEIQKLERRTWQLAGMYALYFERERFTGVPIPIDLDAPEQ